MNKNIYILILMTADLACKKPYTPAVAAVSGNYLVVEGVINTGLDSTVIKLSRTVPLTSALGAKPELGAMVSVLSDAGSNYPLIEAGKGYYKGPGINSGASNKYSIKIMTTDAKVYQSDFVPVKNSPPIDSVYYRIQSNNVNLYGKIQSNGLVIYADTHDPANNTKYYRWDFIDTYVFHSVSFSYDYVSHNPIDTVLPRALNDQIYTCWRSDTSTDVIVNSSAKLAKDVISENQVAFIPSTSEKIESRYSILVRQYALTPDAFNYYQQLKKNTEQIGTIFDAQPSELTGNIHCISDPTETVIGFMTAGSPAEARIYIDNRNLPVWQSVTPYSSCIVDTALYCAGPGCDNQVAEEIYTDYQIPLYPVGPIDNIAGYAASSPACVDCTLRGTNKQPAFWQSLDPGSVY